MSELLFTVLERALMAAEATDGLYDPTLLNQLVQLGYDRTFDDLPTELPAIEHSTLLSGRWRDIHIDKALHLVILPEGVGVDFGALLRAWLSMLP